ncbi:hypothetical protein CFOL_v3_08970 [Cephalotus follicularis]|uniref:Uncharacterized protein n=1 Tax=Cephalotus follicularis TaxID=3775 RepID=A0A1Q3BC41_CEPFO|nr:hypothetical protein CFOL_v3_08970 [Cephalotus follicularis]
MEGKKQAESSSSLTNELFGSNDSSSSTGIFSSLFAPSPKVIGRESVRSDMMGKRRDSPNESWNIKTGAPDTFSVDTSKRTEVENQSMPNRDMGNIYQDQKLQPCPLSSSIFYGGQDIYSHPQNPQGSGFNSVYRKDGGEDDTGSASRGNWWQGGLYY